MKVVKIDRELTGNFMTVSKKIASDKRASLRARGFFLTVMSLGPKWKYSIAGLAALHPGGRDQVYKALNELIDLNYVSREPVRDGRKIVEWIYYFDEFGEATSVLTGNQEVEETHGNSLLTEKQLTENLQVDFQEQAFPTQVITNSEEIYQREEIATPAFDTKRETDAERHTREFNERYNPSYRGPREAA